MRITHSYAVLDIPKDCYYFIKQKLIESGYADQIHVGGLGNEKEVIDMHGIALAPIERKEQSRDESKSA